jgi:small-conductance mechanosensitive channel
VSAEILAELRRINARLDAITTSADLIVTREVAAKQLKVSVRQLQRLIAAGRLASLPSGIARAELERYARTPPTPLPKMLNKAQRERTASEEAERGRALLKALRRPRAR